MSDRATVLPDGLPSPLATALDAPYWQAAREERLVVQRCLACGRHQWPPEHICHRCRSFELEWVEVEPRGRIFSWERVWHPVHPALDGATPYVVVLVELAHADGIRLVGNLVGDPEEAVVIDTEVEAVFEHHEGQPEPFTLVQWRRAAS
jgi:hypothetical protein